MIYILDGLILQRRYAYIYMPLKLLRRIPEEVDCEMSLLLWSKVPDDHTERAFPAREFPSKELYCANEKQSQLTNGLAIVPSSISPTTMLSFCHNSLFQAHSEALLISWSLNHAPRLDSSVVY